MKICSRVGTFNLKELIFITLLIELMNSFESTLSDPEILFSLIS